MRTTALAVLLAASLLAAAPASSTSAGEELPEYSMKAAFLYHFTQFVEWPGGAPAEAAPIVIGILGTDPFGGMLDAAVQGKNVGGRHLSVRRFPRVEDLQSCDILFVSSGVMHRMPEVLDRVRRLPVLTVGEADLFARRGGMIGFFSEDGRLRLEVNVAAAETAGLRLSSKLLSVSRLVDAGKPEAH